MKKQLKESEAKDRKRAWKRKRTKVEKKQMKEMEKTIQKSRGSGGWGGVEQEVKFAWGKV